MGTETVVEKGSGLAMPHPFLKWVGGKGSLLPELMKRVEMAGDFGRYHEPMLGGGALFFSLYRAGLLKRQAWLSDVNPRLMETWECIRDELWAVESSLTEHARCHTKEYYYEIRDLTNYPDATSRAARFIYLNKTCFNGLYRENSRGKFNAPIGDYKNPAIYDKSNLVMVEHALKMSAKLYCGHFSDVLDRAKAGDFVYLDPPYVPISQTAKFTSYHAGGFGLGQHEVLADVFVRLTWKGVHVLLSNSDTPLVRKLYAANTIEEVQGSRSVSCKGGGRGKVGDLLIRNF